MIIRTVGQAVADRPIVQIAPDVTARAAASLLTDENIGALAVVDASGLVGVLSERDIVRRVVARALDPDATRVNAVMTPDPQTVGPDTSLVIAMDLMLRGGFRHLPVVDAGTVFGMLSMRQIPGQYRLLYDRYEAAFTELETLAALGPRESAGRR